MELKEVLGLGLGAIIPIYQDGNVTEVIAKDGSRFIDKRTLRTVLKNIAKFYSVDLAAVRKQYGSFINKRHSIPIPFSAKLVLIPFKARERPLGKNDGTLGYVNFFQISEVKTETNNGTSIVLKSGQAIVTMLGTDTLKEYIKNARLVEELYLSRHFEGLYTHSVFRESHTEKENYIVNKPKDKICPLKTACYDEALLRNYLGELLIEIIKQQKNQAIV